MNYLKYIVALLFFPFLFMDCGKEDIVFDCPTIDRIEPQEASFGTTVTIYGSNFGFSDTSLYEITIANIPLPIKYLLDVNTIANTISFEVPEGIKSGEVEVSFTNGFENDCQEKSSSSNLRFLTYVPVIEQFALLAGQQNIQGCNEGSGINAQFRFPVGLDVDDQGIIYVADLGNHVIKKINPLTGASECYVGNCNNCDGMGLNRGCDDDTVDGKGATFNQPIDVAIDRTKNLMYVAERSNCTIRKVDLNTSGVELIVGECGNCSTGAIGGDNTEGINGLFKRPESITFDESSQTIFVSDLFDRRIRAINNTAPFFISTHAGGNTSGNPCIEFDDGVGAAASFCSPKGITIYNENEPSIYVMESQKKAIREVRSDQFVHTLEVISNGSELEGPSSVATDNNGNLYIVDHTKRQVLRFNINTQKLSVFYNNIDGKLIGPEGIAFDRNNNRLYIADTDGHAIYKIDVK